MIINQCATAGTMESCDIFISVFPFENGIKIELQSTVEKQFGEEIYQTIKEVIVQAGIRNIAIEANDHGALDCTIRARVETALRRAGLNGGEK